MLSDRIETGRKLQSILPEDRIKSRLIDVVSYAADAGFYHLEPKAVVQPVSEKEIVSLFQFSHQNNIPLTFRAAGTSLSGQSITDGILVDLSKYWSGIGVENDGDLVRVQPGVIGATVNAHLKKFKRKIGPDPASINSAMMGGILSNNASGMCCGVSKNSYHTTKFIRFILPDGKSYNTETQSDYARFETESAEIFIRIKELRAEIISDTNLYNRIRTKYKTKNTVGYSLNAFIDHEHPLDILAHLLVGAEGTLGFISEAVMQTVPDYPFKATALMYFTDIYGACKAIVPLTEAGAEAVELMDRSSLRSVEDIPGVPDLLKTLPETAAALLVEFQGNTEEEVQVKISNYMRSAPDLALINQPVFTTDTYEQAFMWKIRKGMFPAVGAVRKSGTTVILEDIAFPVQHLGDAILDLHQVFKKFDYNNAIIFGHAKDGNIHFVVTQAFDSAQEVDRYDRFLREVVTLVVNKYDGALKAEHGTGRNMAPFVEAEWGSELYDVMKKLKEVVDPRNLLNPGVIINNDANAHIHHLKDLPTVEEEVDKCIECGFCEHMCPSRNITTTPRRRIVIRRVLQNMKKAGKVREHQELLDQYQYDGLETCAVDGLCATACPVDINTGTLVKRLRRENHSDFANSIALFTARNFKPITAAVKFALQAGTAMNNVFGANFMRNFTGAIKKVVPPFPLWSNQLYPAKAFKAKSTSPASPTGLSVVYFPTCINRVMGDADKKKKSIMETFLSVSDKAGVSVIIPNDIAGNCCGQIYSSKGFHPAFTLSANDTIEKLWKWTNEGALPVVLDVTSCTQTLQSCLPVLNADNKARFQKMKILDSVDFLNVFVLSNISVPAKKGSVVLHPVCSLTKMGLSETFVKIARHFAEGVVVPMHAGCCGMAGDRGFLYPELTKSATGPESKDVVGKEFQGYYSSGKTCEIAMSDAVKHNYESILYLADECGVKKSPVKEQAPEAVLQE
jgi:D-lactate dehydrogenase